PEGPDASTALKETLVRADEAPIVDMSATDAGGKREISFNNRLAGPVEIELGVVVKDKILLVSEPPLPHRFVLAGNRESRVASIGLAPGSPGGTYTVSYRAVPGDPNAQPDLNYRYRLP